MPQILMRGASEVTPAIVRGLAGACVAARRWASLTSTVRSCPVAQHELDLHRVAVALAAPIAADEVLGGR